jgi:hypothetical protein
VMTWMTYHLHLICTFALKGMVKWQKLVLFDDTKVLYETEAMELIDAIFKMIMKLNDLG